MANLVRLGASRMFKRELVKSTVNTVKLSLPSMILRRINTSSKPPQASTTTTPSEVQTQTTTETSDPANPTNWISYGMSETDYMLDRYIMHSTMFFGVTLGLVVVAAYLVYLPDTNLNDWAQREGFLVLRDREARGLPPIDPDYIDPAKLIASLPTDEELGDTEIII